MDMVGHQYISVNGAAEATRQRIKMLKVEQVILLGMKTNGAVVTTLDDVPGNAWEAESDAAQHRGEPETRELKF